MSEDDMSTLVNITKRQYIEVGEPEAFPVVQVCRYAQAFWDWDIDHDQIELLHDADVTLSRLGHAPISAQPRESGELQPEQVATTHNWMNMGVDLTGDAVRELWGGLEASTHVAQK
jgi:hypothetical protein